MKAWFKQDRKTEKKWEQKDEIENKMKKENKRKQIKIKINKSNHWKTLQKKEEDTEETKK